MRTAITLPSGIPLLLGDPASADWGSAYWGDYKIAGIYPLGINYVAYLDDQTGQMVGKRLDLTPEDKKALEAAQEAAWYSAEHQKWEIQNGGDTSTNPAMKVLLTDTEYQGLVVGQGGKPAQSKLLIDIYQQMSDRLKVIFKQTPLYSQLQDSGEVLPDGSIRGHTVVTPTGTATVVPHSAIATPIPAPQAPVTNGASSKAAVQTIAAAQKVVEQVKPIIDTLRATANKNTTTAPTKSKLHDLATQLESLIAGLFSHGG